ncbi:hypothetical protein [Leptospira santarosai]|nr:hypothetical protein [Leptospira santarosai]MDI7198030.1 hypothetical protein [Leptospira santarosai]MDI7204429.1 hypothetical protein [Leptospira santarosai]
MEEEIKILKQKIELISEMMSFLFQKLSSFVTKDEANTIKQVLEKLKED